MIIDDNIVICTHIQAAQNMIHPHPTNIIHGRFWKVGCRDVVEPAEVPRFLYEENVSNRPGSISITQPRRIAAISVWAPAPKWCRDAKTRDENITKGREMRERCTNMCLFEEEKHSNAQMQRWLAKLVSSCQVANRVASELGCEVGGPTVSVLQHFATILYQDYHLRSSRLSTVKYTFCRFVLAKFIAEVIRAGLVGFHVRFSNRTSSETRIKWPEGRFQAAVHLRMPFHLSIFLCVRACHCIWSWTVQTTVRNLPAEQT